jgi:23S rRNA (cytosine1962-C5)-methyltransferase
VQVGTVVLGRGRDKPVRQRHPWIFSGSVQRIEGNVNDGDLVRVVDAGGRYLATGFYNARSQIRVRLLAWDVGQAVDAACWRNRLDRSIRARKELCRATDACRLVFAESDGLPGLVVDRYGPWVVVQALALGVAARQDELVGLLADLLQPRGIWCRNDANVRLKEGLALETGLLWGEEPPAKVEIREHGHRFLVDLREGHKTGFYLDQRENRRRTASLCVGAEVLNVFAYTGSFGVYAAQAGASRVTNLDITSSALRLAEANHALNGCAAPETLQGDAFEVLRDLRAAGRHFDVVILDPPKFAARQSEVARAARGYKDINLLAMQLLRPDGWLVTFSCSGAVSAELFQKIVFGASLDAERDAQIVDRLTQAQDHPVLLTFPEAEYLKGLICRVG